MKKFLIGFLMVIVLAFALVAGVFAVNSGQNKANYGSVTGLNSVKQLVVGPYTLTGFEITYNTLTITAAGTYFLLGDAANTYTAWAKTVTLTAKSLQDTDGYFKLGDLGMSTNGSGYGIVNGISFLYGVLMTSGPLGVTLSGVAEGK